MRISKVHSHPDEPQWDDIVEVSLLKPAGEEHGTSTTPEEETTLLGEEIKLSQFLGSP